MNPFRLAVPAIMLLAGQAAAQDVAPANSDCTAQTVESPLPGSGLSIELPLAGTQDIPCVDAPPPVKRPPTPDIFGSSAIAVASTPLDERWRDVRARPVEAAGGPWADIVRKAAAAPLPARLQIVNNWVNAQIAFAEDRTADHWANLAETIVRGRGDCEDYAIAKMQLLESAGVPGEDLYLVIVSDVSRHADHAVLAVRGGGELFVLDNRTDRILRSDEVTDYRPIVSFSSEFAWTHGYRAASRNRAFRQVAPAAAPR